MTAIRNGGLRTLSKPIKDRFHVMVGAKQGNALHGAVVHLEYGTGVECHIERRWRRGCRAFYQFWLCDSIHTEGSCFAVVFGVAHDIVVVAVPYQTIRRKLIGLSVRPPKRLCKPPEPGKIKAMEVLRCQRKRKP